MDVEEILQHRIVPERLKFWAERTPDAPFFKCGSDWVSYAAADAWSDAVAASLADLSIGKGSRVAIILPNRLEYLAAILGIARLGAIQVPLNPFLKGEFLEYPLVDCGAEVVITDRQGLSELARLPGSLSALRAIVSVDEAPPVLEGAAIPILPFAARGTAAVSVAAAKIQMSDPVAILYTSGTTGMPKGCVMSHGYYMATPVPWVSCGWIRSDDRIFTAFPMFHASGNIMALMNALQLGISVCYETHFSAGGFIRHAAGEDATVVLGVGPMGMAILATAASPLDTQHRIRLCMWTPMDPAEQLKFEARFNTRVTAQAYGQTEINPVSMGPLEGPADKRGTGGKATQFIELQIVDDDDVPLPCGTAGEIVIRPRRPEVMFSGYWRQPQATLAASRTLWHHTGDYGRLDEDGYVTFVDRKKDALRRRGENISSFELEKAILRHPAIAAVAVHAVPSPLGENDVKACIVVKPDALLEARPLFDWFVEQLPYFAVPRYVEIMDALPTNAVGRVMKHLLRERSQEKSWDFEAKGFSIDKDRRRG